ncbi:peptidoglycan DD-metalloendopeptidase family protein [Microbacterium luticocti]|uniref:peptidoglycan DD-metalloendopeptidase family protein n=1 Tax=Microbacterium luticocti TaxID=451764 RepID=UPI0006861879|nr:peptidoglycan DD-metalloendopeptidase family protein [Microbacterium luticocti]
MPVQATEATVLTRAEARRRAQLAAAASTDAAAVQTTSSHAPVASAHQASIPTPPAAQSTAQPVDGAAATATVSPERDTTATPTTEPAPMTRRRRRQTGAVPVPPASTTVLAPESATAAASVETASTVAPVGSAPASASHGDEQMAVSQPEPTVVTTPVQTVNAGPAAVTAPTAAAAQTDDTGRAEASVTADPFEAAARVLSFTGETPVQRERRTEPADDTDTGDATPAPHRAKSRVTNRPQKAKKSRRTSGPRPARSRRATVNRVAAASVSFSAMVAVGLLAVGATVPAEAVAAPNTKLVGAAPVQQAGDAAAAADDEIQAYVAPADAAPTADLDRSANYTTATLTEMAGTTGISNVSNRFFTNNPACDVQWPFAVGVPITYGFGPRPGEFHTGADFTPGAGAHVQAIADGTVRVAQEGYQGYGVAVIIDHVIDGQHVASLYGHMQYGSLQVHAGEKVRVGQYIGRTGNTGFSFGAHTHVEIRQNGTTPIDPLPWLRQHNQC